MRVGWLTLLVLCSIYALAACGLNDLRSIATAQYTSDHVLTVEGTALTGR